MGRIFNFGAGPSMLPLPVLEQAQAELLDYKGSGMSVMEISHRSDLFEDINHEAQKDIKTLLHLDDNWSVMFMGGGGTLQFSMIPMNFLMPGKVGAYADTGNFAHKAMLEARLEKRPLPIQAAAPVMIGCPKRARSRCLIRRHTFISIPTTRSMEQNIMNILRRDMCPLLQIFHPIS